MLKNPMPVGILAAAPPTSAECSFIIAANALLNENIILYMNMRIPVIAACRGITSFTNPVDTSFLFALNMAIPNEEWATISPIFVGLPPRSVASKNTFVNLFINSDPVSPAK